MTIFKLRSFAASLAIVVACAGLAAFARQADEPGITATTAYVPAPVGEESIARDTETPDRDGPIAATSEEADEGLIGQVAMARAEEEGLRVQVEVLECELAKWVEIRKKYSGVNLETLGEAEQKTLRGYGNLDENFELAVAGVAKVKAELYEAEMMRDALERRLPGHLRRTASVDGLERRLEELERKLDRVIDSLGESNREGREADRPSGEAAAPATRRAE